MPILGILASAITGNLVTPAYESIETVTLGSSTTTITFSSIPATYKHLQLRFIGRLTSGSQGCKMTFNSDTTAANYAAHYLEADPATPAVYASGAANTTPLFNQSGSTANTFSVSIVDILDYADTNKYKTMRALYGQDTNSAGGVTFYSGLWKNTNAITTVTLIPNNSAFWAIYTQAAIYGIKGA
jgi:hypothetical protein